MSEKPIPPGRKPNLYYRPRGKYMTPEEVDALARAASKLGRHGHRDEWLIRFGFRHGLRVSELVNLKREQVNLDRSNIHINRLKGSLPAVHDLNGKQTRAYRRIISEYPNSPYIFVSERGAQLSPSGVDKIMKRAAGSIGLKIKVHPHMLRHSCGHAMADAGVDLIRIKDWLGHSDIHHTVEYSRLSPGKLKGIFPD
jgi:site-specific recombinase XerD